MSDAADHNPSSEASLFPERDRRSSETIPPVVTGRVSNVTVDAFTRRTFTGSNRQTLFVLRRNLPLPLALACSFDCLCAVGEVSCNARLDCMSDERFRPCRVQGLRDVEATSKERNIEPCGRRAGPRPKLGRLYHRFGGPGRRGGGRCRCRWRVPTPGVAPATGAALQYGILTSGQGDRISTTAPQPDRVGAG